MTDAERLIEKVAEALWVAFVAQHVRSEDWPTWGELLAQGHQGLGSVNQFRALALAALAVAEPVVREDEREACARVADAKEDEYETSYRAGLKSNQHLQSMSDGACEVASAIRARGAA